MKKTKNNRAIVNLTVSKRSFTLLEILICLAIVGLLSALFGFQGKKFLDEQRFENSLQLIKGEWEKSKFLSLVYQTDIELEIVRKKNDFFLQRKCDEPGLSHSATTSLPGLRDLRYQGRKPKKIVFAKFSSGHAVEYLPIEFLTSKGTWKLFQLKEVICNSQAPLLAKDKKSH